MPRKVGFIGLGSQGGPMAERILASGHDLVVWARREEALAPYVSAGASVAASIAELGARCELVGICVVDDAGVMAICDELIPAMRAGSILVIHSTILPATCEDLARQCEDRGIGFIDAPVSGGGGAAAAGQLTVMCGGSQQTFDAAADVLGTFSSTVVLLGDVGSGQRAKIINNSLMAATMGLAQAALNAGSELGIDQAALSSIIKVSSGRSFGFDVFARLTKPTDFAHGAALLHKDVNLLVKILPGNTGTDLMQATATPFLAEATGNFSETSQ